MEQRLPRTKHLRTTSSERHPLSKTSIARDSRPANTVSMYAGIGKQKIPTKTVVGFPKSSGSRRSESTHAVKSLHRSPIRYRKMEGNINDGSFVGLNPLKEFKRQAVRGQLRAGLLASDDHLRRYLQLVEKAEVEFMGYCREQKEEEYAKAAEVIIRLLNYSVDYNLPDQFIRVLKLLADFYLITDRVGQAVFYYEQAREGCLLLDNTALLVDTLLGLAGCCRKMGMEVEGIRILKKALQYAWLKGLEEQELRIYDEIGRMHYYLGDLHKARQYHARHIGALHQSPSSALLLLSKQRLLKAEEFNLEIRYRDISRLLLVHLKLPLRTVSDIPLAPGVIQSEPIRQFFDFAVRSQGGEDAGFLIRQILQGWFFQQEIEDPFLPENDTQNRSKKFAFLDFQLNQQLKRLQGNGKHEKKKLDRTVFPVKESLEQQVSRKMKEPPLESDWYEKIVRQINRDHRNKLLNVRNPVRIRGFNKKTIPSAQILKDLFNSLFQRSRTPAANNSSFLSRDCQ